MLHKKEILGVLCLSLLPSIGVAQTPQQQPYGQTLGSPPPPEEPSEEKIPPALKASIRAGAKITYLGKTGILRSYEITSKREDGTYYSVPGHVTPDGHFLTLGYVFMNGHNVTRLQLQRLEVRLAEYKNNAPLSPPLDIEDPDAEAVIPATPPSAQGYPDPGQSTETQAISPAQPKPAEPLHSSSPAGMRNLIASAVASFTLGQTGPEIYFVTAANCASCLASWPKLYEAVVENRIKLTVIFIPTTPSSEQVAATILQKTDPLSAWQSYVANQTINPNIPNNNYTPEQISDGLKRNKDFLSQIGQSPAYLPFVLAVTPNGETQSVSPTTEINSLVKLSAP